jgi:hypothetical protein
MPFTLSSGVMHQFRLTLTRTNTDNKEFEGEASLHVTAAAPSSTSSSASSASSTSSSSDAVTTTSGSGGVSEWSASFPFLAPLVDGNGNIAAHQLVLVSSLSSSRRAYFAGLRITKTR